MSSGNIDDFHLGLQGRIGKLVAARVGTVGNISRTKMRNRLE